MIPLRPLVLAAAAAVACACGSPEPPAPEPTPTPAPTPAPTPERDRSFATEGGVRVEVERWGPGPLASEVSPAALVTLHAVIRMQEDGEVLDDTRESNAPLRFRLGEAGTLPGLREAVAMLSGGTAATLSIPASAAFGDEGVPDPLRPREHLVPPGADLVVELELLAVEAP